MTETIQLVLLPDVPGERDACLGRLHVMLGDRPGISKVHVLTDQVPPKMCIHYDPDVISLWAS